MDFSGDKIVDAIEEGHIVRVSESYAKQEGLPILRRPKVTKIHERVHQLSPSTTYKLREESKRPLKDLLKTKQDWKNKQVISELIDNFHWKIKMERKKQGITRKQLAKLIEEPEEKIKHLEFGILELKDFVLINKIQQTLNINLRKDRKDFSKSITDMLPKSSQEQREQPRTRTERERKEPPITGSDIEILEDED